MNKKEVIEKIEKEKSNFNAWEHSVRNRAFDDALAIVRKLDEPEKPVVPQFVADFISSEQRSCSALSEAIDNMEMRDEGEVTGWFYDNSEAFAKAWLYGYEVEHERQYVVAIPDDERNGFIQLWKNREGKLLFNFEDKIKYGKVHLLTEQEIKQKDERLWKFAEEVKK